MSENNVCFVIAPIDEPGSPIRKRSDQILRHVVAPASLGCGLGEPVRADQINESGIITNQVIQHLIEDAIVVADLTGHNPNVFYELAVRHAFRKPVIQLMHVGDRIPFDVAGLRTVSFDLQDPDSVAQAKIEITDHMRAILENPGEVESPISVAVDRAALRTGTTQEQRFGEVLDAIGKLTIAFEQFAQQISRRVAPSINQYADLLSEKETVPQDLLKEQQRRALEVRAGAALRELGRLINGRDESRGDP